MGQAVHQSPVSVRYSIPISVRMLSYTEEAGGILGQSGSVHLPASLIPDNLLYRGRVRDGTWFNALQSGKAEL